MPLTGVPWLSGSAPGALDPLRLPNVKLWAEGDRIVGLPNNARIPTWPAGPINLTQGVAAQQPLLILDGLNRLPVVRFDGSNDVLAGTLPTSAAWTFYLVGRFFTSAAASRIFSFAGLSLVEIIDNASAWSYYGNQAGSTVSLGGRPTEAQILAIVLTSNGAAEVFRNGVSVATFDPADYAAGTALFVGARNAAGAAPASCEVAAVGGFSVAHSVTERQQIERYLSLRYDILTPLGALPYLALVNGRGNPETYAIGVIGASSINGPWAHYAGNPVLSAGSGFESNHIKDPCLLKVGGAYYCYYSGSNGSAYDGFGLATSPDGITWTKSGSNPVLSRGASGTWDDEDMFFPFVLYEPDDPDPTQRWKMWYGGSTTVQTYDIGYAYSADGVSWTKHSGNPVISKGAGASWEDVLLVMGCVVKSGSTYYIFYAGRSDAAEPTNDQIGLATFTNPKGTYTKAVGNPIVSNRPLALKSLTADTLTGSTVVAVSDTSVFQVNEPVWMNDSNSGPFLHRVASIDSSTQLTLTAAVTTDFTTAQGATIRSVYYGSICPRSIQQLPGGGWVLFGSAYNNNLGELRELSVAFTAPALTGPWTIDFNRGVIVALNQAAWNVRSTENPSVIVA